MPLRYLRAFYTGSIGPGGTFEKTWSPAKDIHVKRIYFISRDNSSLARVDVYIKIGADVITRDQVPASIFGQDPWTALTVDIDVPAKTEIYVKIVNNDSVSHDIVIVFEIAE